MKKTIVLVMTTATLLTSVLAGCGNKTTNSVAESVNTEVSTELIQEEVTEEFVQTDFDESQIQLWMEAIENAEPTKNSKGGNLNILGFYGDTVLDAYYVSHETFDNYYVFTVRFENSDVEAKIRGVGDYNVTLLEAYNILGEDYPLVICENEDLYKNNLPKLYDYCLNNTITATGCLNIFGGFVSSTATVAESFTLLEEEYMQ